MGKNEKREEDLTEEELLEEEFEELESEYEQEEDRELIKRNKKILFEARKFVQLINSKEGEVLMIWLDSQIATTLELLLNTRETRYLSDLRSYFELKKKLTGASSTKESIEAWLKTTNH